MEQRGRGGGGREQAGGWIKAKNAKESGVARFLLFLKRQQTVHLKKQVTFRHSTGECTGLRKQSVAPTGSECWCFWRVPSSSLFSFHAQFSFSGLVLLRPMSQVRRALEEKPCVDKAVGASNTGQQKREPCLSATRTVGALRPVLGKPHVKQRLQLRHDGSACDNKRLASEG